ncbi:antirestriction protein ArdA [uncultured Oscillibacter sp.]|uniref:antirestriction protein ArdA n=1 Tax=uncultured Oscillibacter sp. TaxID=876091 RepID=UPI0025E09063|nr:antirestriction protein ArdA [uncultured Oscillibacter sp.]
MIQAVLTNSQHPEYGVVTVPFPIPREEYDHVMELLAPLEIGDSVARDCRIEEISGDFPVLKQLEQTNTNLDELDYLTKRLDSFDHYEKAQFQGMASKLRLHGIDELINLTFCCQETTIITDFTDLEKVGRRHFLTLGGGISLEKMQGKDFREIAICLMESEVGYITPFGVTYNNGMELSQIYDGKHFPEYRYEDCMMELELTPNTEPGDTANIAFIYLPMTQTQIERTMLRIGTDNYGSIHFRVMESSLPEEVNTALNMAHEGIAPLNQMCEAIVKLGPEDQAKLGAVVTLAQPEYASQVKNLAENLDLFDFIPSIRTPEEYGRYMIQESGHFEYDDNLERYYNYAGYGQQRMANEYGQFNPRGYVNYHGSLSLDELMMEEAAEQQGFQMGCME